MSDFDLYGDFPMAVGPYGVQVTGLLRTHGPALCADDPNCCLHKPSDHPLNRAPMNWRADRGFMERLCPHGVGHPDPDDLAHKKRMLFAHVGEVDWYTQEEAEAILSGYRVHGCDGCCVHDALDVEQSPGDPVD